MSPGGISWMHINDFFTAKFLLFRGKVGREGLIDGIPLLIFQPHSSPDSFTSPEMGWKEEGGDGEGINTEWRERFHDL